MHRAGQSVTGRIDKGKVVLTNGSAKKREMRGERGGGLHAGRR